MVLHESGDNRQRFYRESSFSERISKRLIADLLISHSEKHEARCEKLGLRPSERDHALEVLTRLVYSKSEAEYMRHYQVLLDSGLRSVIEYYNNNWHPIRHQWVEQVLLDSGLRSVLSITTTTGTQFATSGLNVSKVQTLPWERKLTIA